MFIYYQAENHSQLALISSLIENTTNKHNNLTDNDLLGFETYDEDTDETNNQTNLSPSWQPTDQLLSLNLNDQSSKYLQTVYLVNKYPDQQTINT